MIPIAARRKVLIAAGNVETNSEREAAIVGGIVRCAVATGRFNAPWIAQATLDILDEFRVRADRTPPTLDELGEMVERFEEAYGRSFES